MKTEQLGDLAEEKAVLQPHLELSTFLSRLCIPSNDGEGEGGGRMVMVVTAMVMIVMTMVTVMILILVKLCCTFTML